MIVFKEQRHTLGHIIASILYTYVCSHRQPTIPVTIRPEKIHLQCGVCMSCCPSFECHLTLPVEGSAVEKHKFN